MEGSTRLASSGRDGSRQPFWPPTFFSMQVRRATLTFTFQSILMVVGGVVLTVAEWDEGGYRYGPLVYTVATVVATS